MSFSNLGLAPEFLRAVADQGYTEPTPVQAEAIPLVLEGRDLMANAQTGTGKTAAFVLPMLQNMGPPNIDPRSGRRPIRALVLAPTRELALQVEESVRVYGRHWGVRSAAIYGGVGFAPQANALRRGVDVVVATPGRLLDHLGQRTIDLSTIEILVLDEADRMLDMGFIRDIRKVLDVLPARRQNLLFSATFSEEIRSLARGFLHDPASVQVTPRNSATPLVTQVVHPVDRERKRELLSHLIRTGAIDQALVFTRTKHGANRLAEQLGRDGISAVAIHGNKSQGQRVRALADFKTGRTPILVATEIAARGLDIDGLPHVVNFELPMVPEDYVHRIGRTGPCRLAGPRRLAGLRRRAEAPGRDPARPRGHRSRRRSSPGSSPIDPSAPSPSFAVAWVVAGPTRAARAARAVGAGGSWRIRRTAAFVAGVPSRRPPAQGRPAQPHAAQGRPAQGRPGQPYPGTGPTRPGTPRAGTPGPWSARAAPSRTGDRQRRTGRTPGPRPGGQPRDARSPPRGAVRPVRPPRLAHRPSRLARQQGDPEAGRAQRPGTPRRSGPARPTGWVGSRPAPSTTGRTRPA